VKQLKTLLFRQKSAVSCRARVFPRLSTINQQLQAIHRDFLAGSFVVAVSFIE
jgi:hypothetical protein